MVREGLSGRARVLVKRPAKPAAEFDRDAALPSVTHRSYEVVSLQRETDTAVLISLKGPSLASPPLPGQFITVDISVDGRRYRRSYSLTSLPGDATYQFTVKRVAGGVVSTFLTRGLRLGDRIEAAGPFGAFVWPPPNPSGGTRLLLIAGGSGITPIWTILRHALLEDKDCQIHLIYGNRTRDAIVFRSAIDRLTQREPRLSVDHVLEDPPAAWTGGHGRLDAATLRSRLDRAPFALAGTHVFLCGPEPMRREAREVLHRSECAQVLEEVFARAAPPSRGREEVTLRTEDTNHRFVVGGRHSILEAATRSGVELPFSCGMGGCGACRVRLTSGTVEMEEPNCLTPEERDAGFVLTCVGHPTSPCEIKLIS